jgi:hypothetical protein
MHLIIRDSKGVTRQGVLLAASRGHFRLIMPGMPDTLDLSRTGEQWSFADGETAEIEALVATGDIQAVCFELFPRAQAAGRC